MSYPQEYDVDLDDVPRAQLGEHSPMYPVALDCLERWLVERASRPAGEHLLGTFLDLLAAEGYRVTPIEQTPFGELLPPATD